MSAGCVGSAWQRTLDADTASAYHQYMRDYPDSPHTAEAQERIAFHRVLRRPSLAGYNEFREAYPDSALIDAMRPAVEDLAFEATRRVGTPAAYARFETLFPAGKHARRVAGNVVYLTEVRPESRDPLALLSFAEQYPESDFAAEAMRSVAALSTRDRTRFRRALLEVDVSAATPEAGRVRAALIELAQKTYQTAGLELVVASGPDAAKQADAVTLRIRHSEESESARVSGGAVSRAGWMARTEVTLRRGADPTPIWQREFVVRVPPDEIIHNVSALFSSNQAPLYWDQFFVPVATWTSSAAVRSAVEAVRPVSAVDADDGRAVVLFEDGGFDLVELADPEHLLAVGRHERGTTLEHFEGVRIEGDRILVWGQDGLEIVRFGPTGLERLATRPRDEIGSIASLIPVSSGLLLASSRGLLLADRDGANPERLMRRVLIGLDGDEKKLVFTDGESVFVTTLDLLRSGRVIEQFRIGRTFDPGRVRVAGDIAIVMGEGGVLLIHLRGEKPRLVGRFERKDVGEVRDALRIDGRVYLIGSRGLQLLDAGYRRIVESIDVLPRQRAAATGRHLVVGGGNHVQVIDALPFSSVAAVRTNSAAGAAAPAH